MLLFSNRIGFGLYSELMGLEPINIDQLKVLCVALYLRLLNTYNIKKRFR